MHLALIANRATWNVDGELWDLGAATVRPLGPVRLVLPAKARATVER